MSDPTRHPSVRVPCESTGSARWRPRRKRASRRLRNDLRNALPIVAIVLCFGLSAGAIFATGWLPSDQGSSPPSVSAAPAERSGCDASGRPNEARGSSRSASPPREGPVILP